MHSAVTLYSLIWLEPTCWHTFLMSKVTRLQYWLVFMAVASFWKKSCFNPALDKWISCKHEKLINWSFNYIQCPSWRLDKQNFPHLERHGLADHGEYLVQHLAAQLLRVVAGSELGEPGVVLQGADDAHHVPLLQVLEVGQGQLVRVVTVVDGVHVPGNLLSVD